MVASCSFFFFLSAVFSSRKSKNFPSKLVSAMACAVVLRDYLCKASVEEFGREFRVCTEGRRMGK